MIPDLDKLTMEEQMELFTRLLAKYRPTGLIAVIPERYQLAEMSPAEQYRLGWSTAFVKQVPQKPKRLCDLRPGQRFRSENVTGTLLKINSCRAVVKLDGRSKLVSFVAPDGVAREFTASGDRVQSWSRNSEIDEVLE